MPGVDTKATKQPAKASPGFTGDERAAAEVPPAARSVRSTRSGDRLASTRSLDE